MFTPYLAAWVSCCFCARMVLARAMSRRVTRSVEVFDSCCVAFCMRRPKWAFCSSLTSVFSSATSFVRRVAALVTLAGAAVSFFLRVAISVLLSGAELASDERRAQRKLGGGQAERFAGEFFGHADDLEHDLAGLDFSDVVLGVALTVTHPHFSGLGRDG